jgi:hypothetical protein
MQDFGRKARRLPLEDLDVSGRIILKLIIEK